MTVYNFGSINIDLVYRVPHLVRAGETLSSRSMDTLLGGKGANQSVAVARAGASVCHVGRISRADQWAVEQMLAAGVDITHIEQIDGASGHAIIQVDDSGENSIILHGGANQSFNRSILESHLCEASADDWLLVQNECNDISTAFDIAVSKGMKIIFNPAPMTAEVVTLPLEQCAVLIVNETEAESLAGTADPAQILARLASRYPDTRLVMTLGSKGALLQYTGQLIRHDALNVDVVDTTGAGDTFVGYFLASMIGGSDDATCLKRACTAAAMSVTQAGAAPSIPDAAAVDSFRI
ncbi:MAG: ribokinase [Pseudomonadales bacterium]|jgi:ribokinase